MPAHKVGRLWKFKIEEVDEWVRKGGASKLMINMVESKNNSLSRFGFSFERGGAILHVQLCWKNWESYCLM